MRYFPVFLDLRQRLALVLGDGPVARAKITALLAAGAQVRHRIAAPGPAIDAAIEQRVGDYASTDLDDVALVVATVSAPERLLAEARARGIPVNVVDRPEQSTAIMPAIVDRDPITIAIGSAGTAPVLARRLRERLETLLEPSLGALARFAERQRQRVRQHLPDASARRRFWERIFDGEVATLLRDHRDAAATREFDRQLHADARAPAPTGRVTLVGAGTGDPGLLTMRALRAIQDADVVFHDRLISAEVLDLIRRDAERVDVGKQAGGACTTQAEIHARLIHAARAGRRVVRLKCGDPLTFARGGEELECLREHGIDFEVVPGITAAQACAAHAGIPLTHRDHAQAVRFITAHHADAWRGNGQAPLRRPDETLVVYMGVSVLNTLVERLRREGEPASTSAAIVENGSRPQQRVVVGRLDRIVGLAARHQIASPALFIVGPVTALARELHWFGQAPITDVPEAEDLAVPAAGSYAY